MSLQDKINQHLQNEIAREVMIKEARDKVKEEYIERQNTARHRIEELEDRKKLKNELMDDYLLDYE